MEVTTCSSIGKSWLRLRGPHRYVTHQRNIRDKMRGLGRVGVRYRRYGGDTVSYGTKCDHRKDKDRGLVPVAPLMMEVTCVHPLQNLLTRSSRRRVDLAAPQWRSRQHGLGSFLTDGHIQLQR